MIDALFHVYRNGEFCGEMGWRAMIDIVAGFNASDRVMVYRLMRS